MKNENLAVLSAIAMIILGLLLICLNKTFASIIGALSAIIGALGVIGWFGKTKKPKIYRYVHTCARFDLNNSDTYITRLATQADITQLMEDFALQKRKSLITLLKQRPNLVMSKNYLKSIGNMAYVQFIGYIYAESEENALVLLANEKWIEFM